MISRDVLIELIKNFHENELPKLIRRDMEIETELPIKRVISVIGPRRAGKTFLFFQIIEGLISRGVSKQNILYINFEDDRLIGADMSDLRDILSIFYEIYPENKDRKIWLFLDEIQNVFGWEKFVRATIDSEKVQVFITGSSSKFLSREIATSLRGRSLASTLLPFSLKETLRAKNFPVTKYFSSKEKALLLNLLNQYLKFGGYPEAVLYQQKRDDILKEILEVTLYRDVIERYKIKNLRILRLFLRQLAHSAVFSINKFYNFLKSQGMKLGKNTLYNYLEYFRDSSIVFPLRKFSYSYRKLEQSLPKIYFVDNGLLTRLGIENQGKLMENAVFIELCRRGFIENENIFYWSNVKGEEVDFFVKHKKSQQLIQVCYDVGDFNTKEREIRALLKASKEIKCNNLLIITLDYGAEEKIKGKKIKFMPLWKWLLQ